MEKLNITLLLGTLRKERQSLRAAEMVKDVGKEFEEINLTFVDIKDFFLDTENGELSSKSELNWKEINRNSDGYFIVSPEYNHSFPGHLKILLDSDFENYKRKPVAVAGVSSGIIGGARMVESLVGVLKALGLVVIQKDVYFSEIGVLFESNSTVQIQKQKERISIVFKDLVWMARALKQGRSFD